LSAFFWLVATLSVGFFALACAATASGASTATQTATAHTLGILLTLTPLLVSLRRRRYQRRLRYNGRVKVFVAGASGVIGRPLIRQLLAAGHQVTGMTRREQAAALIRDAGASAAVCDVFDQDALDEAVTAAAPEVVIHQLTALPARLDPRERGLYEANNRIRTEGTRNLVAAAAAAGARRLIAQSIAFVYAPVGGPVKSEEDPVMRGVGGEFGTALDATFELERQVLEAEGLVLRYGFFYGPGSSYASDGHQASEVRRRRFPIVGNGGGVFSFIQIEDAAAATVLACERGASGVYNVCDSEPAPLREWLPVYAEALGAKRPWRAPKLLARLVAGADAVAMATTLRGASNGKAMRELGWEPRYPSWRRGFAEALG
jgi:nucleoside-diphosphate-sugar epimerase